VDTIVSRPMKSKDAENLSLPVSTNNHKETSVLINSVVSSQNEIALKHKESIVSIFCYLNIYELHSKRDL